MKAATLREFRAILEACDRTAAAIEQTKANVAAGVVAAVEQAETILRVNGYEFKDGSYLKSDQYKAYRAKVDEIHAMALALKRRQ